ncbi:MAG: hypothetical protein KDA24_16555 [Deltaproteobacteria bacterium]|nr:hypothetical protein [Deltaproteobacteria bacterium]
MRLTIVVGVQGGADLLPEWVRSIEGQRVEGVEVLLVWASGDEACASACRRVDSDWVRLVEGPRGALIPGLWSHGIVESDSERVAITVHHCEPGPHWVRGLLDADLSRHVGVGGPIAQAPGSDGVSWAVYLQRYAPFSPGAVGASPRPADEIAGDNALYRRDRLAAVPEAWSGGFWELDVHRRLRELGGTLGFDPALLVTHRNGYTPLGFSEQRLRHGFLFGAGRARRLRLVQRIGYRSLSPAIPFLFGRKVFARALAHGPARPHLLPALPWLLLFLCAWSLGEGLGANRPVRRAA